MFNTTLKNVVIITSMLGDFELSKQCLGMNILNQTQYADL